MKNLKITRQELEKCIEYHKFSKSEHFDFVIEDLKKQLKNIRETTYRINSAEEMFRLNHTLNGFENCINYIQTQARLYKDYNNGIISIREEVKADEN
jgi:hypothetical protein